MRFAYLRPSKTNKYYFSHIHILDFNFLSRHIYIYAYSMATGHESRKENKTE